MVSTRCAFSIDLYTVQITPICPIRECFKRSQFSPHVLCEGTGLSVQATYDMCRTCEGSRPQCQRHTVCDFGIVVLEGN